MSETGKIVTQTHPAKEEHVTKVTIGDIDYVTVIGCHHRDLFDRSLGNKAMFINQGIRQIRLDQKEIKPTKGRRMRYVFLMFREEYEEKVLKRVGKIIVEKYKAEFRVLDSINELMSFINELVPQKKEMVKKLSLFAHGTFIKELLPQEERIQKLSQFSYDLYEKLGTIEFGYETNKKSSYRFGKEQAKTLKQFVFEDDAEIYSYACRTGVGVDKESFEKGDEAEAQYSKSLAQIMANSTDVLVWAYPRRSHYLETYGTAKERKGIVPDTRKKMAEYERRMEDYREEMKKYSELKRKNEEYLAYHRRYETPAVPILEEQAPHPPEVPMKDYTDEEEDLVRRDDRREIERKRCGLPIDPDGAVRPVKSGDTPKGLPEGMMEFVPISRQQKQKRTQ